MRIRWSRSTSAGVEAAGHTPPGLDLAEQARSALLHFHSPLRLDDSPQCDLPPHPPPQWLTRVHRERAAQVPLFLTRHFLSRPSLWEDKGRSTGVRHLGDFECLQEHPLLLRERDREGGKDRTPQRPFCIEVGIPRR